MVVSWSPYADKILVVYIKTIIVHKGKGDLIKINPYYDHEYLDWNCHYMVPMPLYFLSVSQLEDERSPY